MSLARNKTTEKEAKESIDLLIDANFEGITDDLKNSLRNDIFEIVSQAQEELDRAELLLLINGKRKPTQKEIREVIGLLTKADEDMEFSDEMKAELPQVIEELEETAKELEPDSSPRRRRP
jgi:hypothetical protein